MIPALTIAAAISIPAMATPVTGTIDVTGPAVATVTTGAIYWGLDHGQLATNPISITAGSATGDFTAATSAWFRNLVNPAGPMSFPITGPVNIPDFAEFTTPTGVIRVDLTDIPAGPAPACTSGVTFCSPTFMVGGTTYSSPFTLLQSTDAAGQNTVAISLTLQGVAYYPPPSSGVSQLVDIETTQVANGTISGILADVSSTGFSHSFSGSLAASGVVPEPGSILLMGVGLFGVGLIARKRIRG